MSELSMPINGLAASAERNATFERCNPLGGAVATRAPAASPADAVRAVEAASQAFRTWSETGPGQRRMLLLRAADKLEAKLPQLGEAVAAETGATGMWAGFNVKLAAGVVRPHHRLQRTALLAVVRPVPDLRRIRAHVPRTGPEWAVQLLSVRRPPGVPPQPGPVP